MDATTSDPAKIRSDMIEHGREVLRIEADALRMFSETLDDSFAQAVAMMQAARGRIILSGMGKSGLIARKIAATLASTGAPALFVHPAEASHGDLGMITQADVVVLLSNSGETPELADIIAYTRRFTIPLIGIASRSDSTLMKNSDHTILLPRAPEACPNGLAPTTSTTLSLALGDALAVALMQQRRFTPEDFRDFHPGGKLGARLASVADLMHNAEDLPLVPADMPMPDVLLVITSANFGVAGVVDGTGGLIGVITDGDLRRRMKGLMDQTAGEVMTANPATITPTALAAEAVARMNQGKNITKLFVLAEGDPTPLGIISIHDCLRAGIA